MSIFADTTFLVALAFIAFLALLVYLKVPQATTKALDGRAERIRAELEEARQLREEAQALLADYQRKQRAAEEEAAEIVAQAKEEARRMSEEAKAQLKDMIERRSAIAEMKIGQAEAQAVADVRNAAAEAAVQAAQTILAGKVEGEAGDKLIDAGIKDLKSNLQ